MGDTSPPGEEEGDALDKAIAEVICRTGETEREKFEEDGRMLV